MKELDNSFSQFLTILGGKTQSEVGEMDSPVWVPDSSAAKCMHCHRSEFSMLNRRVSLYMCGRASVAQTWLAHLILLFPTYS